MGLKITIFSIHRPTIPFYCKLANDLEYLTNPRRSVNLLYNKISINNKVYVLILIF